MQMAENSLFPSHSTHQKNNDPGAMPAVAPGLRNVWRVRLLTLPIRRKVETVQSPSPTAGVKMSLSTKQEDPTLPAAPDLISATKGLVLIPQQWIAPNRQRLLGEMARLSILRGLRLLRAQLRCPRGRDGGRRAERACGRGGGEKNTKCKCKEQLEIVEYGVSVSMG